MNFMRSCTAVIIALALLMLTPVGAFAANGGQQEQQQDVPPPAPPDQVGGANVSVMVGSMFGASTAAQVGGSIGYFLKPNATLGFEVEGDFTFGLDGRVAQIFGSLVLQTGARTSKIVPYGTIGAGIMYAKFDPRQAIKDELNALGIVIREDTEIAPGFALGIGVRYFMSEKVSMRGDFRNYWMWRSIQGGFNDHLYTLRRVAGGIVWEF
jgi:opacity protein-like surface antigen